MGKVMFNFYWRLAAVFFCFASTTLSASYSFLGDVDTYQRSPSGIILTCRDNVRLKVEFLLPNMYRVILERPGDQKQPLLDYPLAKTDWPAVPLKLETQPDHLILDSGVLKLFIQKSPCRLIVRNQEGNILNQDDPGMGIGWDGNEVRNWKAIDPDEKFFGLGEKGGALDKRGRELVMWNTDNPHHNDRSDPLYQSIPFFIGMRKFKAYGIYFNNSYRSKFNLGAGNLRYFSFGAAGGRLDYFFYLWPECI